MGEHCSSCFTVWALLPDAPEVSPRGPTCHPNGRPRTVWTRVCLTLKHSCTHSGSKGLALCFLFQLKLLEGIPLWTAQLICAETPLPLCNSSAWGWSDSQVGLGASLAALLAVEFVAAHPVLRHQVAPVEVVLAEGVWKQAHSTLAKCTEHLHTSAC